MSSIDQALHIEVALGGRSNPFPPEMFIVELLIIIPFVAEMLMVAFPPILMGIYALYGPPLEVSAQPFVPEILIFALFVMFKCLHVQLKLASLD